MTPELKAKIGALCSIKSPEQQIDHDGVMIGISRQWYEEAQQALAETLNEAEEAYLLFASIKDNLNTVIKQRDALIRALQSYTCSEYSNRVCSNYSSMYGGGCISRKGTPCKNWHFAYERYADGDGDG
jgi:hypothetical protein